MKNTTVLIAAGLALLVIVFALFNVSPSNPMTERVELKKQIDTETELRIKDSIDLSNSFKDSIQIIKKYTSEPNSAGGVDLNIIWKNKTKRTIKYARFEVSAINAVNDEVFSDIGLYDGSKYVQVTGPVKPNTVNGYGTYWDCLWYNSTIKKCLIRSVELEFMDGTKVTVSL
jgi:hypothetical protein